MNDNIERILQCLAVRIPVDGWAVSVVRSDDECILVGAPHDLATAALDAWYGRVVDGVYSSAAESEADWEACRAAVRREAISLEQLVILLGLAGARGADA